MDSWQMSCLVAGSSFERLPRRLLGHEGKRHQPADDEQAAGATHVDSESPTGANRTQPAKHDHGDEATASATDECFSRRATHCLLPALEVIRRSESDIRDGSDGKSHIGISILVRLMGSYSLRLRFLGTFPGTEPSRPALRLRQRWRNVSVASSTSELAVQSLSSSS